MIGRTPEYLGKQIGPTENKMVVLYALSGPVTILVPTAISVSTKAGLAGLATNTGPHGLTEILFGFIHDRRMQTDCSLGVGNQCLQLQSTWT
jgi:K+-transporting ATPase ATPase A chain